jgi:hypothetical protein
LQKVALNLGERDARSGAYALQSGLSEGDKILRFRTARLKMDRRSVPAPTPSRL